MLNAGALERKAPSRTILVGGEDGPRFVDLIWYPDRNAYGYFDAADGHVVVAADEHAVFRLNPAWWLRWLATDLDLGNATQPTEIVPNHAWDIGDLWITRQRKVPVLFSRRLYSDVQLEALQIALSRRRGRAGGLVLTSSQNPLRNLIEDPTCQVVPISSILTNDADKFAVDRDLVMSPYISPTRVRGVAESIYLSPDGRRLVINGDTTIDFKSDRHVKIIRRLVDGYHEGKRFRASELLGGATVMTLRRAFGAKKWALLAPYLKSKNETWSFDLD